VRASARAPVRGVTVALSRRGGRCRSRSR
jgi:hypothetical protein